MNAEAIRDLLRRQPFVPFEIRMTSGENHRIGHPENAMIAGTRLVVVHPETDRLVILSVLHAAAIEMMPSSAA